MSNDLDEILVHARKKKTPAQSREILIQAGIFSSAGKLADHYKAKSKTKARTKSAAKPRASARAKAAALKAVKKIEA